MRRAMSELSTLALEPPYPEAAPDPGLVVRGDRGWRARADHGQVAGGGRGGAGVSGRLWALTEEVCMAILDDIKRALSSRQYRVSSHAADEMVADDFTERQILEATGSGEVIEDYPSAFPCPACLVLGRTVNGLPIHAVWAFDAKACYATLVTVYKPDPGRWTADLRKRVKS